MPFEVFSKHAAALSREPRVSIQKKGIISLDRAAFATLGEPEAVELLFDSKRQLVGLRKVDPGSEDAHLVRRYSNDSTFVITAIQFTRHYGIKTDVGHRWVAQTKGDLLFIDISQAPEA